MPPLTEYAKAAQAASLARLGYLQIGILDTEVHNAQLIRHVLNNIGVTHTYLSRDSEQMVEILGERQVDVFITEWDSRPQNGLEMVHLVRARESRNRLLPIIMITSRASPEEHREAIDTGINEIVVRPFNIRQILTPLLQIIEQPRDFVLTRNYVGPDRRRNNDMVLGTEERRTGPAPRVVSREWANDVFIDDVPRVIPADYALRRKLDAAAEGVAPQTVSERGPQDEASRKQDEAGRRHEEYAQAMTKDIQILRQTFRLLSSSRGMPRPHMERMAEAAVLIRARALRAGYAFVAQAAAGLLDFSRKNMDPQNPSHLRVMEKYIDALQALVTAKLNNDDPIGNAIVSELQQMAKRFS